MGGWTIGIIGGSGLYAIDALEGAAWSRIESPWGAASGDVLSGTIAGHRFVFLPRHGRGHRLSPSDLNSRANIDVLKRVGCTDVLAISAVGSLREDYAPGDFVLVDQFIDRSFARAKTFFGAGLVAHVSMADPVCPRLSGFAAAAAGPDTHAQGTYLAMEGPQFSTRAESELYQSWGCAVIGMTAMPEAKLAREAELPYALVGMVTDYDCWRADQAPVEVSTILAVMHANAARACDLVVRLAHALPPERLPSPIVTCLDWAVITAREARDPALVAKLDAVAGRVLR